MTILNLAWKVSYATFVITKEDTLCQTPKLYGHMKVFLPNTSFVHQIHGRHSFLELVIHFKLPLPRLKYPNIQNKNLLKIHYGLRMISQHSIVFRLLHSPMNLQHMLHWRSLPERRSWRQRQHPPHPAALLPPSTTAAGARFFRDLNPLQVDIIYI